MPTVDVMAATVFRRWVVLEGRTHQLNPWRSTAERFVALCGAWIPLDTPLLKAPAEDVAGCPRCRTAADLATTRPWAVVERVLAIPRRRARSVAVQASATALYLLRRR